MSHNDMRSSEMEETRRQFSPSFIAVTGKEIVSSTPSVIDTPIETRGDDVLGGRE